MKFRFKVFYLIFIFLFCIPFIVSAKESTVRAYVFYSKSCPHCRDLENKLNDLSKTYKLNIYKYEVLSNYENKKLMGEVTKLMNVKMGGVPFMVIGSETFIGYTEGITDIKIEKVIKVYHNASSYQDLVGEKLNIVSDTGDITYEDLLNKKEVDEQNIKIPLIGSVNISSFSLPIIAILIGTVDGFNPCAMWVLLFLISFLINLKDCKKMWILGLTFIITSALIYLLFMLAWLNLAEFIGSVKWFRVLIAVIALVGGVINIRSFIRTKDTGCQIVDEKKRINIFSKIKKYTTLDNYFIAILGIMTIAISVNFIEITCSAGLPVIFTNILALNNLSRLEYGLYIFLYILFFLIDDIIIFTIAMISFKITAFSNKLTKYSHLIGGIIMLLIAILMLFKPEWLMFNF